MAVKSYWNAALVVALAMLTGCELSIAQSSGRAKPLTTAELDEITAGAASATIDVAAHALPPFAQTSTTAATLSVAGSSPLAGPPFLGNLSSNFSTSQGAASATSGELAETSGSSHTSVSGPNGGARIDAAAQSTAEGSEGGHTQLSINTNAFSTSRADIAFGTVTASACCAPMLGAEVTVDAQASGPYSVELRDAPVSDTPGQVQSRIDITVASSALPIIDPGAAMLFLTPHGSPQY